MDGTQERTEAVETRPPTSPWVGVLITVLLWAGFAWLLAYTMLDIPFLLAIGSWNYVLLLGLVAVLSVILRRWRPDMRRHVTAP